MIYIVSSPKYCYHLAIVEAKNKLEASKKFMNAMFPSDKVKKSDRPFNSKSLTVRDISDLMKGSTPDVYIAL